MLIYIQYYNVKYSAKTMIPLRMSKRIYVDPESHPERKERYPQVMINSKVTHMH